MLGDKIVTYQKKSQKIIKRVETNTMNISYTRSWQLQANIKASLCSE